MMKGMKPGTARNGDASRFRRAAVAVAVSAAVAVAVATPAALRVIEDEPAGPDTQVVESAPEQESPPTDSTPVTVPETIPPSVLGTSEIREGP